MNLHHVSADVIQDRHAGMNEADKREASYWLRHSCSIAELMSFAVMSCLCIYSQTELE